MKLQRQLAFWGLLAMCTSACAEKLPGLGNMTPEASLVSAPWLPPVTLEPVMIRPVHPCARFIEPFDVDDYRGPLNGIVTRFSQGFDNAAPHLGGGTSSKCHMTVGDKFRLFVNNNIDPASYL